MNVKQIVEQWLRLNNFDGLYNLDCDGCGCTLDDLMPCDGDGVGAYCDCEAGVLCRHKEPEGECEGGPKCKCVGPRP